MSYFPFFVELENKNVLVVGGGHAALHKVKKLVSCGAVVTVVAKEVCARLDGMAVTGKACMELEGMVDVYGCVSLVKRGFLDADVEGRDFCIAATNDSSLNARIHTLCSERGILMNSVDDKENCDFIFPAVVRRGRFVAGVSTSGAAPRVATLVTERLQDLLPDNLEEILDELEKLRAVAKENIPDDRERARFLMEAAEKMLN